jgi:hypothetical protein
MARTPIHDLAAQRLGNAFSRIPQRPVTNIARHRGRQSAWVFSI